MRRTTNNTSSIPHQRHSSPLLLRRVSPRGRFPSGCRINLLSAVSLLILLAFLYLCTLFHTILFPFHLEGRNSSDNFSTYIKGVRQQATTSSVSSPNLSGYLTDSFAGAKLIFQADFGLGHRLSKLSSAYHLAGRFHIPTLEVIFGSCQTADARENDTKADIFEYLFGSTLLGVLPTVGIQPLSLSHSQQEKRKIIRIRNDVLGYYAGQNFKNAHVPINSECQRSWKGKIVSDLHLFQDLVSRFQFLNEVETFQRQYDWNNKNVIALHLRAGNGEMDHFVDAQRNQTDPEKWVYNILRLLLLSPLLESPKNGTLLFIATDTPILILVVKEKLKQILSHYDITVAVYPQPHVESGSGVSFSHWTSGAKCYEGWKSSMIDMLLIARADSIIAASRSTFTQILPLSILLGRESSHGSYCEVHVDAMSCFDNIEDWLYRNPQSKSSSSFSVSLQSTDSLLSREEVFHKVMIHFPDPNESHQDLISYLRGDSEEVFRYGRRFNPKYRDAKVFERYFTLD